MDGRKDGRKEGWTDGRMEGEPDWGARGSWKREGRDEDGAGQDGLGNGGLGWTAKVAETGSGILGITVHIATISNPKKNESELYRSLEKRAWKRVKDATPTILPPLLPSNASRMKSTETRYNLACE